MRRSYLVLALVCTSWGTIPLVARHVSLPAAAIVFVRVWVAAVGVAGALLARRLAAPGPRGAPEGARPGRALVPPLRGAARALVPPLRGAARALVPPLRGAARALAAGALLALHWTTMFAAYQRAPADTVIFVIFLAPVGVALLAPHTLGERVGPRTLTALALALAGFTLVAGPGLGAPGGGDGVALAALSSASLVVLVLVSKPLAEVHGGLRLTLLEMTGAGLALIPVAVTVDWTKDDAGWGWLVLLGLVHTALFVSLYLSALARVPATHAAILGYLEPAGVVVFSWLLLGSVPRLSTVGGGLLIAAAGVLVIQSGDPAVTRPEVTARVPG